MILQDPLAFITVLCIPGSQPHPSCRGNSCQAPLMPYQAAALQSQGCKRMHGQDGNVYGLLIRAGIVRRQWVWVVVFSPLWGILFVSFGIGPIVSRTSDLTPILQNTAAFLAAALAFRLSPLFKQSAIDTSILKRSAQEGKDDDL